MKDIYKVETRPNALAANMVVGDKYRITILTEGLLRLEYSEDGVFEDRATQMVFFRDFPEVKYRVLHTENGIEIHTSRIQMIYNEKEFSSHRLSILSDDIFKIRWSWKPPLSHRFFRGYLDDMGVFGFPAIFHRDSIQYRIWLVESRYWRSYAGV